MEPVYSSVIGVARGVFAMQGLKFTILGDDNVPRTGGAVMTINHTGYFDFAYAGLAVQMAGPALWPAVVLHTVLTIWCLLCLRA